MSLSEEGLIVILLTSSSEAIIEPTNAPLYCSCDGLTPLPDKLIGKEDCFRASPPKIEPTIWPITSFWPSPNFLMIRASRWMEWWFVKSTIVLVFTNSIQGYLMHIEDR